jgi:hypothetical protein
MLDIYLDIWLWVNTYKYHFYGVIHIHFNPAILMFTTDLQWIQGANWTLSSGPSHLPRSLPDLKLVVPAPGQRLSLF